MGQKEDNEFLKYIICWTKLKLNDTSKYRIIRLELM